MEKQIKAKIQALIFLVIISCLALLIFKGMDNKLYEPNCWEERIEGINTQTGERAYYSENFRCKYFNPL